MDRPSGVTMLSDLPSLDDIQGDNHIPMGRGNAPSARDMAPESAMKFVRQNYVPPSESGMGKSREGYSSYGSYGNSKQPGNYAQGQYDQWNNGEYQSIEGFNHQPFRPSNGEILEGYLHDSQSVPGNCVDTSYHVKNCPICSQLYRNDKGIYIISIVILIIICIILLKKVLNL